MSERQRRNQQVTMTHVVIALTRTEARTGG